MKRLNLDEYFFNVLDAVATRATCDRGRAGALIVREGRILATGYVGAPAGIEHCDVIGHMVERRHSWYDQTGEGQPHDLIETEHCVRTVHAEMNAIIQAARFGPSIAGAKMYCTIFPCYTCAKVIVNAGIVEVKALYDYQLSKMSKDLFDMVKISWSIEKDQEKSYKD
jgi:dCMP deaminase